MKKQKVEFRICVQPLPHRRVMYYSKKNWEKALEDLKEYESRKEDAWIETRIVTSWEKQQEGDNTMPCSKTRYGQAEAAAYVKRRDGAFAFRCAECDGTHVAMGDRSGKLLEMSNDGGKVLMYFQSKITKVGGSST